MEMIVARSGMSTGAVCCFFPGKDAIISAAVVSGTAGLHAGHRTAGRASIDDRAKLDERSRSGRTPLPHPQHQTNRRHASINLERGGRGHRPAQASRSIRTWWGRGS
jgi:AcrR family transcriptional regulator